MGLDDGALPALDHVQVAAPAGCEGRARRFYGEFLGLPEIEKPEALRGRGGVWFALAGAQLHVGVVGSEGFVAAVKAHPALRIASVAAIEALAERLGAAGFEVCGTRSCQQSGGSSPPTRLGIVWSYWWARRS